MHLTLLDGIVIAIVVISAVLAMVRGFVREVLSVGSWVAAAGAAYFFHGPVVPLVRPYIASDTVATIIAAAVVFFVALIIASYVTMKISDVVIDSRMGTFDRILGFGFGAVRGLVLLVVALLFFSWLVPQPPAWVSEARTKPMLDTVGARLMAALPKDVESTILNRFRHGEEAEPTPVEPAPEDDSAASGDDASNNSYSRTERRGLDQLIQNAN
jgi:membrane protein required for colicin V production